MAKITHESVSSSAKSRVPGGTPSASCSATIVPSPIQQPRKEVTPRTDPGNQGRFHRGAVRVWNAVRPKASSRYRA